MPNLSSHIFLTAIRTAVQTIVRVLITSIFKR